MVYIAKWIWCYCWTWVHLSLYNVFLIWSRESAVLRSGFGIDPEFPHDGTWHFVVIPWQKVRLAILLIRPTARCSILIRPMCIMCGLGFGRRFEIENALWCIHLYVQCLLANIGSAQSRLAWPLPIALPKQCFLMKTYYFFNIFLANIFQLNKNKLPPSCFHHLLPNI